MYFELLRLCDAAENLFNISNIHTSTIHISMTYSYFNWPYFYSTFQLKNCKVSNQTKMFFFCSGIKGISPFQLCGTIG